MTSVYGPIPAGEIAPSGETRTSPESDDAENIPYHARENARPFTYGNLPVGFNTSDLSHVPSEIVETPSARRIQSTYKNSPSSTRKSTRPGISPSRPVLRKTPSRQEFEEMLMERKEKSLREQNNAATKLAQEASIQKEFDELHEKLNKTILSSQNINGSKQDKHIDFTDSTKTSLCPSQSSENVDSPLLAVEKKRPETPTFPVVQKLVNSERCISPYPSGTAKSVTSGEQGLIAQPSITQDVEPHLVKFAKDLSQFWYKPHMTREEAVMLLRTAQVGTFLIRNSTTYRDSYGLVLRVAKAPPSIPSTSGNGDELVRHFLLEPTNRGIRLKGCANEPIFTSLSAFVYQHSINSLALPCTLVIPYQDLLLNSPDNELMSRQKQILVQGAACNVLYLYQCDTESLTGLEAVRKSVHQMYLDAKYSLPIEVHLKISQEGITLTDNTRKTFFRRHYPAQNISHFSMDPNQRFWSVNATDEGLQRSVNKSIFAFVARPLTGTKDNQCHIFCDLASSQPASAIVSFANKVLPLSKSSCKML
ncbi:tensin-2-like [Drosophila persimilis]|uniref:tensin-2-like n=1 Tax=Drosophila persimilis TaxID=7234 RepID=UPI000F08F561|nr:tensin-2-like [Drosophila persimilis]